VLLVDKLTVEYRSGDYLVRPLDGFDLSAKAGELVLLLGASGCGKTTLLSALAGILTPKSGRVLVGDTDVAQLSGADLVRYRRRGVGVVFQAFNLVPSLSAAENVQATLRMDGVRAAAAKARAIELLDRVGLADRAHAKPGQLSGGQQQRAAIARALALDPPLILADEPTAHLDYVQCEIVLTLLRELASDGRTVVIATHDDRLLPLADRVVELTPRFTGGSMPEGVLELSDGAVLFRQGDASDVVYLVEAGAVEVLHERADGTNQQLAVLEAGRYVGELGPLLGLQRSATARAVGDVRLRVLGPHDFRAQVGRTAGVGTTAASAADVNGNGNGNGNGAGAGRPRRERPLRAG
jgi:putative ABC transport system ATP-binding protein